MLLLQTLSLLSSLFGLTRSSPVTEGAFSFKTIKIPNIYFPLSLFLEQQYIDSVGINIADFVT